MSEFEENLQNRINTINVTRHDMLFPVAENTPEKSDRYNKLTAVVRELKDVLELHKRLCK